MSLRALDWVLSVRVRPAAGHAAKLILFALADEADDTGTCCSSDQLLAAKCEISEAMVRQTIRRLAEASYLSVESAAEVRVEAGTKRYHLAIDALPAVLQTFAPSKCARRIGRSRHPSQH